MYVFLFMFVFNYIFVNIYIYLFIFIVIYITYISIYLVICGYVHMEARWFPKENTLQHKRFVCHIYVISSGVGQGNFGCMV